VKLSEAQDAGGSPSCPCLSFSELNAELQIDFEAVLGGHKDEATYGVGCASHDEDALTCSDANGCASTVPLPLDCDKSHCTRAWCYVDEACPLMSNPSAYFKGRYYSYATCGELDRFTQTERLQSLKGKTFKVGFTSNSGGWKGGFNPEGSFAINELWRGPIVDFVKEAALVGGFTINMTAPPAWIKPKSLEFFGGSSFDYCVFATALGYLDFCVSGFSITEKRASVTTMFEATSDPLYLIVHTDEGNSWETFITSTLLVFQPFTLSAWAIIFLFALPLLGVLMFLHEYGSPGSAYPKTEPVLVVQSDGETRVVVRPIPLTKHIANSFYAAVLSFYQGSYDLSVVTPGGKINLLAIASFIMLILAVYTANLAAILTQDAQKTSIDSIEAAVMTGYNFCAERKLADTIIGIYGIDPNRFVPDPVELGGDGKPGFNCPDCDARERTMEMMRRTHNDPSMYCNAAIAKIEDLQVMHRHGNHCDKTKIGESLGQQMIGIPIFDDHAASLNALLHKLKDDGVMAKTLLAGTPESQCPVTADEGSSLNPQQLTGIWVITFGFAIFGLLVRCYFSCSRGCLKRGRSGGGVVPKERKLWRYDQWLNPPGYDVIVDGYRYDGEKNELVKFFGPNDLTLTEGLSKETGDTSDGGGEG
jgi:hypothetical protein